MRYALDGLRRRPRRTALAALGIGLATSLVVALLALSAGIEGSASRLAIASGVDLLATSANTTIIAGTFPPVAQGPRVPSMPSNGPTRTSPVPARGSSMTSSSGTPRSLPLRISPRTGSEIPTSRAPDWSGRSRLDPFRQLRPRYSRDPRGAWDSASRGTPTMRTEPTAVRRAGRSFSTRASPRCCTSGQARRSGPARARCLPRRESTVGSRTPPRFGWSASPGRSGSSRRRSSGSSTSPSCNPSTAGRRSRTTMHRSSSSTSPTRPTRRTISRSSERRSRR